MTIGSYRSCKRSTMASSRGTCSAESSDDESHGGEPALGDATGVSGVRPVPIFGDSSSSSSSLAGVTRPAGRGPVRRRPDGRRPCGPHGRRVRHLVGIGRPVAHRHPQEPGSHTTRSRSSGWARVGSADRAERNARMTSHTSGPPTSVALREPLDHGVIEANRRGVANHYIVADCSRCSSADGCERPTSARNSCVFRIQIWM